MKIEVIASPTTKFLKDIPVGNLAKHRGGSVWLRTATGGTRLAGLGTYSTNLESLDSDAVWEDLGTLKVTL